MPTLGSNDLTITITALDHASSVLKRIESNNQAFVANMSGSSSKVSSSLEGIDRAMTGILKRGAIIAGAGSFGIGAMTKASWDQVGAVEQSSVALGAYEKNADKVKSTLSELVGYAQSDMGVLFQRQDLFNSAQQLKIMGDNTDDLVDHVKILSRSVGLGLSNWEDLNQIVGRVGSTGRLTGNDFDLLRARGFKLDDSLRNTNITWDDLFKALDKGMPADAMAGQAETIEGKTIRLQSAFRNLGNEFLGVDEKTSTFTKGGLGDTLMKAFDKLIAFLKTPEMKQGLKKMGDDVAAFVKAAEPVVQTVLPWLMNNLPLVVNLFLGLAGAVAAIKIVRFGADVVDAGTKLFNLGATAAPVVANIAKGFGSTIGDAIGGLASKFSGLAGLIGTPIAMPAIAVGAALAALGLVIAKHQETMKVIEETNKAFDNAQKVSAQTDESMKKAAESGRITQEQYQTYLKNTSKIAEQESKSVKSQYEGVFGWINLQLDKASGSASYKAYQKATGGKGYASGGFTGRGGTNEIAGVVHRGEYVVPQKDVDQSTGLPKAIPASATAANGASLHVDNYNVYNNVDHQQVLRDIGWRLRIA